MKYTKIHTVLFVITKDRSNMNKLLWHIHTMECYSMSKTRREEMTGKWKSKVCDGCRTCHHVSKNQGR